MGCFSSGGEDGKKVLPDGHGRRNWCHVAAAGGFCAGVRWW